jgi:hypothetical protein
MGCGYAPDPSRDLLIWCPDHQLVERLSSHLQKSTIGLKKAPFPTKKAVFQSDFHYFQQKNALFSRKKMAAELHSFFGVN